MQLCWLKKEREREREALKSLSSGVESAMVLHSGQKENINPPSNFFGSISINISNQLPWQSFLRGDCFDFMLIMLLANLTIKSMNSVVCMNIAGSKMIV